VGLLTVAHGSRASGGWSAIGCYCRGSTPTAWGLGLRNSAKTTLFKFFFFSFFLLLLLYIFFYLWGPKNGLQQLGALLLSNLVPALLQLLWFFPHKDSDAHTRVWEIVSSNRSSSCQSWAFRPLFLPFMEGGSVRVPCRVWTILK
jgi:hypothetical protein